MFQSLLSVSIVMFFVYFISLLPKKLGPVSGCSVVQCRQHLGRRNRLLRGPLASRGGFLFLTKCSQCPFVIRMS